MNTLGSIREEQELLSYYERQMFVYMVRVLCAQSLNGDDVEISVAWDDEYGVEIIVGKHTINHKISFQMVMGSIGFEKAISESIKHIKYQLIEVLKLK